VKKIYIFFIWLSRHYASIFPCLHFLHIWMYVNITIHQAHSLDLFFTLCFITSLILSSILIILSTIWLMMTPTFISSTQTYSTKQPHI
jgi:hypothetical protein